MYIYLLHFSVTDFLGDFLALFYRARLGYETLTFLNKLLWGSFNFILNDFSVALFIKKHFRLILFINDFQLLILEHSFLYPTKG
jgi:hypothetical protein